MLFVTLKIVTVAYLHPSAGAHNKDYSRISDYRHKRDYTVEKREENNYPSLKVNCFIFEFLITPTQLIMYKLNVFIYLCFRFSGGTFKRVESKKKYVNTI